MECGGDQRMSVIGTFNAKCVFPKKQELRIFFEILTKWHQSLRVFFFTIIIDVKKKDNTSGNL